MLHTFEVLSSMRNCEFFVEAGFLQYFWGFVATAKTSYFILKSTSPKTYQTVFIYGVTYNIGRLL